MQFNSFAGTLDTSIDAQNKITITTGTTIFGDTSVATNEQLSLLYGVHLVHPVTGQAIELFMVARADNYGGTPTDDNHILIGLAASKPLDPNVQYLVQYGNPYEALAIAETYVSSAALQPVPGAFPDGIVEGTEGADSIHAGYTGDPDGDKIDNNDNTLAGVAAGGAPGSNDDLVQGFGGNDTIRSGAGNDTVYAGHGADFVDGGTGNDVLYGYGDTLNDGKDDNMADTLIGGQGNDSLYGGGGDDKLYGDDTLGTDTAGGNDYLDGGTGNDTILGGYGNDTILGGAGADSIDGGYGDDSIDGGTGNDIIFGGAGKDTILGGDGDDSIDGGDGDDSIDGGIGNDTLLGGNGHDTIYGGAGDDSINGGSGNDSLSGGAGNDRIDGGTGSDTLNGGDGTDTLLGGDGDDRIYVGEGDSASGGNGDDDFILDPTQSGGGLWTINGGEGFEGTPEDTTNNADDGGMAGDKIDGSALTTGVNVTYSTTENGVFTGGTSGSFVDIEKVVTGSGDDTINASVATIIGGTGINIDTGAGNDIITGSSSNDLINAGAGNDVVNVTAGSDTVSGGAGTDKLNGAAQTANTTLNIGPGGNGTFVNSAGTTTFTSFEQFATGSGNDTIDASTTTTGVVVDAGAGNDLITGGSGNDTLLGGDGADTLKGGGGNDSLVGGEGDDDIYVGAGDFASGGAGDDEFIIDPTAYGTGAWTIDGGMHGTPAPDDANGSAGDILNATNVGAVNIQLTGAWAGTVTGATSGTFTDIEIIHTGSGNDVIDATLGQISEIDAGAGDDTVYASSNTNTTVYGGDGNDLLIGDPNSSDGRVALYGGDGSDTIYGGGFQGDILDGGDGDDLIHLGTGDVAWGGAGDDKFVITDFSLSTGAWQVIGGEDGEDMSDPTNGGTGDELVIENGTTAINVVFTGNEEGTVQDGTVYGGIFSEIEKITTGAGNDTINASTDNSTGLVLSSGAGNDSVIGGSGADTIDGGAGNDFIDGGAGDDLLKGGEGFDTFVAGSGADTILDFGTGDGDINDGDQSNNDFIDLDPYYNKDTLKIWNENNPNNKFNTPLEWLRADQADGHLNMLDGTNGLPTLDLKIQNGGAGVDPSMLTSDNTNVFCFTTGTLIETDRGPIMIETLAVGDLVMTRDRGLQPIRWIGQRVLSGPELTENLRPVLIRKGALGENAPSSDLMVSPQHRVLVRSRIAQKMFGASEVLVAAKQLCQIDGIDIANPAQVTYVHLLFDNHEVVISNGAETESLFTGLEALKSVGNAARDEIFAIFPELADRDYEPMAVRMLASGRMGRKLAVRHAQNGKALVS